MAAVPASAQEQFNSNSGSGSGSPQSCDEAYQETEHQIVAARIAVDANFKKQEMDCNGDSGCRRSAGEEYQANMRDIAKQQVDATAQHDTCVAQAMGGGGGGGVPGAGGVPGGGRAGGGPTAPYGAPQNPTAGSAPNNAPLGSPQNPLRGYVSNAPPPKPTKPPTSASAPARAPSAPQNPARGYASTAPNSGNAPPNPNAQPHTPLGYLNQALNDAVAKIPGGSQGLQQAGVAASQVDRNINSGLNDAARKMKAIRDSMADDMIKKWTRRMTPQEALTEVVTNWAGNAAGAGLGAGAGSLLKGAVAGGMTRGVASQAAKAAARAAVKEGAVTAGAGSALKGAGGALASRGPSSGESGAPPEGQGGGPGESPNQPTRLSTQVAQEATEFGNDFGADAAPNGSGSGTGNQPAPRCFARNACFKVALAQAHIWQTEEPFQIQGARDIGKSDLRMTGKEIQDALRHQFGGKAAAGNPVYTPVERMAQRQGTPVLVSPTRLRQILGSGKIGSQWLVFIQPNQGISHVFNARFVNGGIQMWDATQKMNGELWFSSPLKNVFVYQIH